MKFKIDENLPAEYAALLRDATFEADTVGEEAMSGAECQGEGRILITLDLDFSNIQAYPPGGHAGIIVIRSKTQTKPVLLALLQRLIPVLAQRSPERELWIVEHDRVRFRGV